MTSQHIENEELPFRIFNKFFHIPNEKQREKGVDMIHSVLAATTSLFQSEYIIPLSLP